MVITLLKHFAQQFEKFTILFFWILTEVTVDRKLKLLCRTALKTLTIHYDLHLD
jgi:hypothetical protein